MKNVCFFINTMSAAGGTQRVLTTLANLLVAGFDTTIMVLDNKKPFFKLDESVNIRIINSSNKLQLNYQIYLLLKKEKCDYYISLDSNSILFQSLFLPRNVKLIIWEHFSLSKNSSKLLFKTSRMYAALRAHKLVLLSQQEVISWRNRYKISQKKLSLIYNPITIKNIKQKTSSELYQNKKVLAIGNNIAVKGFDYLLKVWSLFNKNGWTLEIVGLSEEEKIKLSLLASKYVFKNEIIISGKITNIEEKYLESSIYCLTSRMEATPLVLIESQYVGLPAVVFDNCEGVLELLNESAEIIEYPNLIAYKEGLERLMNSSILYDKVSSNARNNSKSFGKDVFYEKWLSILN